MHGDYAESPIGVGLSAQPTLPDLVGSKKVN